MINLIKMPVTNINLINKLIFNYKNNSLPNSLIFSGPKGIGKATSAFFFINKILNLYSSINNNQNLIYNNTHPNVKLLTREYDEKSSKLKNFITIDQIRHLNNFLFQSSIGDAPKFVLIDSSDDLNINASNALLKILEEPRSNTFLILISHQISSLLPTIRSRSINFNFKVPTFDEFKQILKIANNDNIYDFDFLYKFSNNSPGLAIDINSDKLNLLYSKVFDILKLGENLFSDKLLDLSEYVSKFTNHEFKIFIMMIKYTLLVKIKNNLGIIDNNNIRDNKNSTYLNIIEYLNENEKDLYTYNLDKKIFCINIFTPIYKKIV